MSESQSPKCTLRSQSKLLNQPHFVLTVTVWQHLLPHHQIPRRPRALHHALVSLVLVVLPVLRWVVPLSQSPMVPTAHQIHNQGNPWKVPQIETWIVTWTWIDPGASGSDSHCTRPLLGRHGRCHSHGYGDGLVGQQAQKPQVAS